jgi:hypothetical protein
MLEISSETRDDLESFVIRRLMHENEALVYCKSKAYRQMIESRLFNIIQHWTCYRLTLHVCRYIYFEIANTKTPIPNNFSIWSKSVKAQRIILWALTPFDLVDIYRPLQGRYCLLFQGIKSRDGGIMFFWKVRKYMPHCTESVTFIFILIFIFPPSEPSECHIYFLTLIK